MQDNEKYNVENDEFVSRSLIDVVNNVMDNKLKDALTHSTLRAMTKPKGEWTKTAPTVPGFYWFRDKFKHPRVVELDVIVTAKWFTFPGQDDLFDIHQMLLDDGEFWSEPLQVP